jgi:hypothetical protein
MSNITTAQQGFAPTTLTEAMTFSEMLAKSQMVPKAYQGKPEDVLVAMQWGRELGLAPLQALQNIACINGKPSVYGDAAMALVQASHVCEDIEEFFEGEDTPNPVAVCIAQRRGRKAVKATFSLEDAKRAGLWGKPGPWQAYPKRMMQMRARGFALRDAFPDVLKGLITAEEAQDFPSEARPAKDITPKPRNPLEAIAPPEPVPMEDDPQREHVEIEEANQQAQEAAEEGLAEKVTEALQEAGIDVAEVTHGLAFNVPGKPEQILPDLGAWEQAYMAMAERVATAGKAAHATRVEKMTALRNANVGVLDLMPMEQRLEMSKAIMHMLKEFEE